MKFYVGLTDKDWYDQLKAAKASEVNFWKPGTTPFHALPEGGLFLFKLHKPYDFIVGGGFFVSFTQLPPWLAWRAFGTENGTQTFAQMDERIKKYRRGNNIDQNAQIGCIVLTDTFWFEPKDWIMLEGWKPNIVSGRTYETTEAYGCRLYNQVMEKLEAKEVIPAANKIVTSVVAAENGTNRYTESLTKHRLGQGGFRVVVTDAYQRRCAITGEKTLPVLEAAHIQSFSENGPNLVTNGLLLKSDVHTLFDRGYITVTEDYHVEVSKRLHEDYGNGKDYYKYHGSELMVLPDLTQRPNPDFLRWHNEHIYLG